MAASATFALKPGVWFRRGRLLMVSPDKMGTACPLSGRNSTYRPVQISGTGSNFGLRWVKLDISTRSDTRIQHAPREPLEEQGPYLAIAAILEGEIEQVVEQCNPLVSVQIR